MKTGEKILCGMLGGSLCAGAAAAWLIAPARPTGEQRDLISGLNHSSEASVEFIKKFTKAAGIITTKGNLIGKAQELDLRTVLRYFILDSKALDLIGKQSRAGCVQPDLIEILPGAVRSIVIERIRKIVRVPVICGGLISSKEEVVYALKSGALAISATNEAVWKL